MNADIKEYIEKFCIKHGITEEEALEYQVVKEYIEYKAEEREDGN